MIRDALRLRGGGGLEHPLEMLEYRMVPLLTELMQVGNELSCLGHDARAGHTGQTQ